MSILGCIALLAGLGIFIKAFFFTTQTPMFGALQVNAIPKSTVFLDGVEVGQTPYTNDKLRPGDYSVKVGTWDQKVTVLSGVLTYVSREFYSTSADSAGQVLTLEKIPSSNASELAVVSEPNSASVIIDGLEKGKAPVILKNLTAGQHTVAISLSGYSDQVILGRLINGYRLNAVVNLQKIGTVPLTTPDLTISQTPATQSAQVQIQDTPTGFLRVRSTPDINASESGRVYPGEKYPVVSQNDNWVEIKFKDSTGWVSKDYVEIEE